jgi:hypothetical protein
VAAVVADERRVVHDGVQSVPDIGPARSGGRVLNRAFLLAKGKGLSSAESLATLAKTTHLSLTGKGVLGIMHLDVGLRVASVTMLGKEATISTVQDIYLGIGKLGVVFGVRRPILSTDMTGHDRGSVSRVFAV